jgi:hypothetical protein
MTIITPQGTTVAGNVSETRGYIFYKSFMIESGGFYTINIELIDDMGNQRFLEKIVVVQVPAVEDIFFMTVLWSLVGVVVVGLGYVGVKRFARGRRRRKPRREESWEPEWASDSGPPAIQ